MSHLSISHGCICSCGWPLAMFYDLDSDLDILEKKRKESSRQVLDYDL
jgi:hypothetical protein